MFEYNRWYEKKTTGARVYLVGDHPSKDVVAITGGEDDVRWVKVAYFLEYFELIRDLKDGNI